MVEKKITIDDVVQMAEQTKVVCELPNYSPKEMYEARSDVAGRFADALIYWIMAHAVKFWTNELMMPVVVDVPEDTPPDSLEIAMQRLADREWSTKQANNGRVLIVEPTRRALAELHAAVKEDEMIDDLFDSLKEGLPQEDQPLPCKCGEAATEVLPGGELVCVGCYAMELASGAEDGPSAES